VDCRVSEQAEEDVTLVTDATQTVGLTDEANATSLAAAATAGEDPGQVESIPTNVHLVGRPTCGMQAVTVRFTSS